MAQNVIEISDASFQKDVLESNLPVLVDFWAPWCGPCRAVAPVVEEIALAYDGKLKVAKCNVDDNPVTAGKFGIRAIPTLMLFKDGSLVEQVVGLASKSKLEELVKKYL